MTKKRYKLKISRWLTLFTLFGLMLGMILGFNYSYISTKIWASKALDIVEGVGFVWVNLLQIVAIPLIVFLVWDVLTVDTDRNLGKMGFQTLAVFLLVLIFGSILIILIIGPVLSFIPRPELSQVEELKKSMAFESGSLSAVKWKQILYQIFHNDILEFLKKKLWIWLLFPIVLTLGSRIMAVNQPLSKEMVGRVLDFIFKVIGRLLQIVPLAVMGLTYAFTRSLGYSLPAIVMFLILGGCVVIIIFIFIQLLALLIIGKINFSKLIQVLKNPFLVAMSSRSSLATLPVLAEETGRYLELRPDVTGFVFPFSATFLKITNPVSNGLKMFFIAHIFHVELGWSVVVVFFLSTILITFLTQGIPAEGNTGQSLPLFVAAGVPAEGFILAKSFFTIPDIFETVSNVTGYLLAAVFVHQLGIRTPQHSLSSLE